MADLEIDLDLWLNKSLIERQNRLKSTFIEVLDEVGNAFPNEFLKTLHGLSKGKKISKGNDLLGYPYLVLDLVKVFDRNMGMNFRVLNWFGHGCYLLLFFGKEKSTPMEALIREHYQFGLLDDPWDFGELILEKNATQNIQEILGHVGNFQIWIKKLKVNPIKNQFSHEIIEELEKVFKLVSRQ